jgi:hypothetical protein
MREKRSRRSEIQHGLLEREAVPGGWTKEGSQRKSVVEERDSTSSIINEVEADASEKTVAAKEADSRQDENKRVKQDVPRGYAHQV